MDLFVYCVSGITYFGEYPLAFAACLGHKEIYNYLMEHGADPNKRDTLGNTVLHMCVIKDLPEMYEHAVRYRQPDIAEENQKIANQWVKNWRRIHKKWVPEKLLLILVAPLCGAIFRVSTAKFATRNRDPC